MFDDEMTVGMMSSYEITLTWTSEDTKIVHRLDAIIQSDFRHGVRNDFKFDVCRQNDSRHDACR